jgi:class 3 adenylate cyclase/DNA-binding SARP family transcriptional activator
MTESGVVALLFTDLVGSTEMLSRLGDDTAEALRRDHFELLRRAVADAGGTEVKTLGDGIMAVFGSPLAALRCATSIVGAVAAGNQDRQEAMAVRVGVHAGEPIAEGGDFHGTAVVVARRLCDAAAGGQVLASELVAGLVGRRGGLSFRPMGRLRLKGLAESVAAVEVTTSGADAAAIVDAAGVLPVRGQGAPPGVAASKPAGTLRVRVLGTFMVEGIDAHHLGTRKARTLLKVLALHRGRPVSVDHLTDCLWPEGTPRPERSGTQISVLVSRMRGVIGAERLPRSDAGYALMADWLDLDAMDELVAEAGRRLEAGSYTLARTAADAALTLARGPLLADEPDAEWAELERISAARLLNASRSVAAAAALAVGDHAGAAECAETLLDADPYDEAALRLLMAAHAGAGRPGSALAAYARARARLAEDLGVDPSSATEAVHTAILREEPIPGVVVGSSPSAQPAPSAMHPSVSPLAHPPASFVESAASGDLAPGPGSLAGREAELAALDAALGRASAGSIEIVAVEGEAGIGKTHLISVWTGRARAAGVTVLTSGCDQLDRSLPLQAVVDAVAGHLRAVGAERAAELTGPDAATLAPLLGREAGRGSGPGAGTPVTALTDPATGRALLFAALLSVLERACGPGPVVVVLDDMHQAGTSTVDWLQFAARRGSDLRLLILLARRTGEGPSLPVTGTVALGPLDLAAAEAVVGPERAADLHARSGGHPLFLVELAAADPSDELPASIREAVAARCERAGPAAPTLRTAAVVGSSVDLDLLAAVLQAPPVELLDHLEEGVRRALLVEEGFAFAFRHPLVREALASGTSASRRALIHRETARALGARASADPLEVAYHARLGGDDRTAAAALVEAAALASTRFDFAEADRLLNQALTLSDTADGRLLRARVRLMLPGRFAEVAEDARVALGLGAGAPALEVASWAAYYQRDFPAAVRLADDGARLADDPELRASCLTVGGNARTSHGDLRGAEAQLEEALALATGPSRLDASGWLGCLRTFQGRAAEAVELLRPATLPGAVIGPGFLPVRAGMFMAYALCLLGRADEALAALNDMEADRDRRHADRYIGCYDNFRGWLLRNVGASGEADEANQRAAEMALTNPDEHRRREITLHSCFDLAEGALRAGDLDVASLHLERAAPLHRESGTLRWRYDQRAGILSGRLALARGDAEEAFALALGLAEEAERLGARRHAVLARLLEADARAVLGETVDAAALDSILGELPGLAGLEAWWLTAHAAAASGVEAWWGLAERRLADLIDHAGPYAEGLRRYGAARLERMRTTGRKG